MFSSYWNWNKRGKEESHYVPMEREEKGNWSFDFGTTKRYSFVVLKCAYLNIDMRGHSATA